MHNHNTVNTNMNYDNNSLISDGQQFQQYQQNEHPSFTSTN